MGAHAAVSATVTSAANWRAGILVLAVEGVRNQCHMKVRCEQSAAQATSCKRRTTANRLLHLQLYVDCK
jgi:hypothetical protein